MQLRLGQIVASRVLGGRQADGAGKLRLGLDRRHQLQLVQARGNQGGHVLGRQVEQSGELRARGSVVAFEMVEARLHIERVRVAWPCLCQTNQRLSSRLQVFASHLDDSHRVKRFQLFGIDLDRALVGSHRLV